MANQYTATPIPSDLEQLYQSGMTQTEIAKRYGVSQKVVWKWMQRAGLQARVAAKRDQRGERNTAWKGDEATYAAFHYRVQSARGSEKRCEACGTTDPNKSYDWANLTGNYADISDYRRLCRSCHWTLDAKVLNIKKMRRSSRLAISSAGLADSPKV